MPLFGLLIALYWLREGDKSKPACATHIEPKPKLKYVGRWQTIHRLPMDQKPKA